MGDRWWVVDVAGAVVVGVVNVTGAVVVVTVVLTLVVVTVGLVNVTGTLVVLTLVVLTLVVVTVCVVNVTGTLVVLTLVGVTAVDVSVMVADGSGDGGWRGEWTGLAAVAGLMTGSPGLWAPCGRGLPNRASRCRDPLPGALRPWSWAGRGHRGAGRVGSIDDGWGELRGVLVGVVVGLLGLVVGVLGLVRRVGGLRLGRGGVDW